MPDEMEDKIEVKMREQGYLRFSVACKLLGKTLDYLHHQRKAGKIECTRVGHPWYVKVDSLALFLGPVASRALGLQYPFGGQPPQSIPRAKPVIPPIEPGVSQEAIDAVSGK